LGPTGCGKTTLLRIIAGVEEPTSGKVFIDGEDVTMLPPQKRNVSMVFQDFALYPHMSVYENIIFGLKSRGYSKQKIYRAAKNVVDTLLIHKLLDKLPSQLSFGQKQRVALARVLTRQPKVFLFDEPLSNLDARLREHLRIELKKLHQNFMATILYVTHDQTEAMALSNRIVLMKNGEICQIGTPQELYFFPKDTFVAKFIGVPEINLVTTKIIERDHSLYLDFRDTEILLPKKWYDKIEPYKGREVIAGIRPNDLYDRLWYEGEVFSNTIRCRVDAIEILGDKKVLFMDWYNKILRMIVPIYDEVSLKENIDVVIDINRIHLFDIDTQMRII
ncbi:MAG: ABC transporter ATP-binding protein, partial [Endomicrobia bacterium]|nr:ABC transporter ATP-binding protein [Endomicrobiia bacterium]